MLQSNWYGNYYCSSHKFDLRMDVTGQATDFFLVVPAPT